MHATISAPARAGLANTGSLASGKLVSFCSRDLAEWDSKVQGIPFKCLQEASLLGQRKGRGATLARDLRKLRGQIKDRLPIEIHKVALKDRARVYVKVSGKTLPNTPHGPHGALRQPSCLEIVFRVSSLGPLGFIEQGAWMHGWVDGWLEGQRACWLRTWGPCGIPSAYVHNPVLRRFAPRSRRDPRREEFSNTKTIR